MLGFSILASGFWQGQGQVRVIGQMLSNNKSNSATSGFFGKGNNLTITQIQEKVI